MLPAKSVICNWTHVSLGCDSGLAERSGSLKPLPPLTPQMYTSMYYYDLIFTALACSGLVSRLWIMRESGGGILPYMGYIGMCGPKG